MPSPAASGPRVSRDAIIQTLVSAFRSQSWVHAAYLGGSDASGRTDEYSDIDFQVIVDDDQVEEAFEVVLRVVRELSPILHRYRLPDPTWHGSSQIFLSLRDADPAHFLDFVAVKRSRTDRFLEPERHGHAQVLFDRAGIVTPDPFDRETHESRMRARFVTLRETFPLFQTLVTRAVRRGFPAEAAAAYQAHTFRPLVELLRMRHCPDRFDFGPRYLDRDLPAAVREEVERLALPSDLESVEEYRARAEALFSRTLEEWNPADEAGESR